MVYWKTMLAAMACMENEKVRTALQNLAETGMTLFLTSVIVLVKTSQD